MTRHQSSLTIQMGETSSLLGNTVSPLQQEKTSTGHSNDNNNHDHDHHHNHHGSASVTETIINEAKTCMGTGCLALPYAARVGGITLHVTGLVAIGLWNIYSVHRLCQCLSLLPKEAVILEEEDKYNNSKNGETIHATTANESQQQQQQQEEGVAEIPAMLELSPSHSPQPFHHRPHSSGGHIPQTYDGTTQPQVSSSLPNPPQTVDLPPLPLLVSHPPPPPPPRGTSTYSRVAWYAFGPIGLLALDLMMISLFIGVVVAFVDATRGFLRDTPVTTGSDMLDAVAIAFIIGPMSAVPDMGYLSRASAMGLAVLFLSFVVIAVYGLMEHSENDSAAADNHNTNASWNWLPENGIEGASQWFGCVVFGYGIAPLTYNFRESMTEPTHMVQASTVALLIVAGSYVIVGVGLYAMFPNIDGDILHTLPSEGWLPIITRLTMAVVVFVTAPLLIVPCGQLVEGKILKSSDTLDVPYAVRASVRIGIALTCVSISVLVPGFVGVLSLVGCLSVAAVGFVVPPLLFLRLRVMRHSWSCGLILDVAMLIWGIAATGISTSYTFVNVMQTGTG